MSSGSRKIRQILPARPASDGAGVAIQRVVGRGQHDMDPFLMLDEIRSDDAADFMAGFPAHPHRGIETLTYLLSGGFVHEDHLGHRAVLKDGGAQWMSTGRGIIHSEMPINGKRGMHGFQLWINLPAKAKMKEPEYRNHPAEEIPSLCLSGGGEGRVLAGTFHGIDGPTAGPLESLAAAAAAIDVRLPAGVSWSHDEIEGRSSLFYIYDGYVSIDSSPEQPLRHAQMVLLDQCGGFTLTAGPKGAGLLYLSGRPLGEPIVQHGPFVMNTADEIRQAVRDYQDGTLVAPSGTIKPQR